VIAMSARRYRVAQWATGHSGVKALRGVIEHPLYDLVGVYVYSDEKAGRDAGDIAGVAPTGVIATRSIEDIIAARPDCVLYMPLSDGSKIEEIAQLLESGANVITIVTDDYAYRHPASLDPADRKLLEEACERGQSSLYATGPSPGFITEQLPLAFLAMMRRLDSLTIYEFADMRTRNSPEMIDMMFGGDPAAMDLQATANTLRDDFGKPFLQLAEAVGLSIDDFTAAGSVAVATHDEQVAVTTIKAGTVAAWHFEITGRRAGKPLMTFHPIWYVSPDLDPPLPVRDSGWKVVIEGDPPFEVDIHFAQGDAYGPVQPGYNAYILVNAIPNIVEATPGIRTTVELPPIIPTFAVATAES
jgi:4-hydroxy-tetrahydrodipicolinate reductase